MKLDLSPDDLRPIVSACLDEMLRRRAADDARLGDKLAFKEPEAAALLSIRPHVLRDMRLRGEIAARRAGKCYVYSRGALLRWLSAGDGEGRGKGRK